MEATNSDNSLSVIQNVESIIEEIEVTNPNVNQNIEVTPTTDDIKNDSLSEDKVVLENESTNIIEMKEENKEVETISTEEPPMADVSNVQAIDLEVKSEMTNVMVLKQEIREEDHSISVNVTEEVKSTEIEMTDNNIVKEEVKYEEKEKEDESSDSESSSESSSSSSSSESESESESSDDNLDDIIVNKNVNNNNNNNNNRNNNNNNNNKRKVNDDGEDDFDSKIYKPKMPEEKPLELTLPPNTSINVLGTLSSLVDDMIVIKSFPSSSSAKPMDRPALDIDSIVCLEDRTPIGRIYEVFGQISDPYYSVRVPSNISIVIPSKQPKQAIPTAETDIAKAEPQEDLTINQTQTQTQVETVTNGEVSTTSNTTTTTTTTTKSVPTTNQTQEKKIIEIELKTPIYYVNVPDLSKFVVPSAIYTKGFDASNENDDELEENEMDFSDDEKEREFKNRKKRKNTKSKPQKSDLEFIQESFEYNPLPRNGVPAQQPPRGQQNQRGRPSFMKQQPRHNNNNNNNNHHQQQQQQQIPQNQQTSYFKQLKDLQNINNQQQQQQQQQPLQQIQQQQQPLQQQQPMNFQPIESIQQNGFQLPQPQSYSLPPGSQ
ncbi:hypothetical protein PPL_06954 [Heterostelium album PN500]|uniref:H/ACA ribonucleoprotein complex non-core subunit NAF1 n=1 Tax=Heterostelium pallidum (strain ATCC 26659 / Pp 5 / PN500) TaxID=670386 RepID=D3BE01_HETP5|nr:hypothetical protein PPL_06954 [Heterostelium album PN500]EFA80132.1 hypothetical protein PPL_06954 [Heterostelium album PN500]|eukprot:XP_020432252.1 hypothetical protein PPL_06954 [Heterostelium album PN500]